MYTQLMVAAIWYMSYGVVWAIYCTLSTLYHPSYKVMGFTKWRWVYHTILAITLWPYVMYGALMKSKEEGQKVKDMNKGIIS